MPAPDLNVKPRRPTPEAMDLAEQIADAATKVEGVDNAVAIVISNLAMLGITLERDTARNEVEIKREVAKIVEERQPRIVSAYVSANPDIIRQLQEISSGIQRGEPISTFFDQISEVLRRMRAETNT
ncbi:MAG: YhcN/YlaJ family sporulation lipoprotein [Dethiobacter sp.]